MKTRYLGLALVVLLLTCGVAWAGQEAYKLAIGKDGELCKAILQLVNADVKRYREISYEEHPYFKDIGWGPADAVLGEQFISNRCSKYSVANFDIDNDGKRDFVIKHRGCLSGKLTDSLYILDDTDATPKFKSHSDIEDRSRAKVPLEELNSYFFDLVPQSGSEYRESIGGHLVIQPFSYSRANYILLTDEIRYWIIISRLTNSARMDNVCILEMSNEESMQ